MVAKLIASQINVRCVEASHQGFRVEGFGVGFRAEGMGLNKFRNNPS